MNNEKGRVAGGNEKRTGSKRTYEPREKAEALAHLTAAGGNVKRAALAAGIPRKTLEGWGKGRAIDAEVLRMTEDAKKNLAEKFMREADGAIDAAAGKREGASYRDLMIGAAVAVDKAQLLTGGPTSITTEVERRRQTAEAALERLYELARERGEALGLTVTREEVRDELCRRRPELRPVLLAEDPRGEGVGLPA